MDDFFAEVSERWPAGREDYCWHVLPGSAADRERLAYSFGELTERPGLIPVRPEWMHVAVQHLGPVSGITGTELARMTRLVQGRCGGIAPFTVTAGRAEAWEAGVVCPVRPGYLLRFPRQVIAEVRAWLSDCEAPEPELLVARLVLVAQRHDRREITWRVIDEVALSGSTP